MIPGLTWTDLDPEVARAIFGQLLDIEDADRRALLKVKGRSGALPFYREWRLVWLVLENDLTDKDDVPEDVLCLWHEGETPLLLDGTSDPVHDVNARESLALEDAQIPDYIRWFCLAVRAEAEKPFVLFERPPAKVSAKDRKAAALAQPLTPKGRREDGAPQFETTVIFDDVAFTALFAVPKDGVMEMVDDNPLLADFPAKLIPAVPPLGIGPRLASNLVRILGTAAGGTTGKAVGGRRTRATATRRRRTKASRPTIVELVELLLARSLQDQSKNRLLGYFNAALPAATELQRFAALVGDASPVVVVETTIPFVEETIGEIVNGLRPSSSAMTMYRAHIETDSNGTDVVGGYMLPMQGPGMVLMPLQVYPRLIQAERLAFDIAAKDLAAIISTPRFGDLPESLRRYVDVVLRLPPIDAQIFETLFGRVIGKPCAGHLAGRRQRLDQAPHPHRFRASPAHAAGARAKPLRTSRARSRTASGPSTRAPARPSTSCTAWVRRASSRKTSSPTSIPRWPAGSRGRRSIGERCSSGPPGTGKTTLARAIAKACGIKFIQGSATGWMAEGVSLGPHIAAIRKTFAEARDYSPSILFIDEIDTLGNREAFSRDNNSVYQTEIVNAVLEQIQGLDPAAPVFLIGATNREEGVDPALRRAGRLDRVIRIPRPNSAALDDIYRYYIAALGSSIKVDPKLDTLALGKLSVGLTGADVERIVRGAARRARKAGRALRRPTSSTRSRTSRGAPQASRR